MLQSLLTLTYNLLIDKQHLFIMNNFFKHVLHRRTGVAVFMIALAASAAAVLAQDVKSPSPSPQGNPSPRAALSVTVNTPQSIAWPVTVPASGNVAAWQEALVGSEIGGLRVSEVLVNVGDTVKKGQVLARISATSAAADVAAQKAAVAEAQANANEAQANAERARSLQASGAISAQQILQFDTAAKSAVARLESAKARLQVEQVRFAQTRIMAPDAGVITARAATVGQVTQPGQEMFRLIRQNRLEWRAEVTASEALNLKAGQTVLLTAANGAQLQGKVRMIAPTVDTNTRNTLVYVDLPITDNPLKAGMFSKGVFELGKTNALTIPQQALVLRDGFTYAFTVAPDNKVAQVKVAAGRRVGDRVEITQGLKADQRIVSSGAAFLADGDTVRVITQQPTIPAAAPAPQKSPGA
jgi:HlyD family secretion protein